MRGSFSSDPMYWWYKSLTYGVVDRQVTLLYALEIASWSRSEMNNDGTMTITASEVGYYLSPEDGRVLEFKSVEAVLEAGWRLVTTARAKESPLRNSPPLQSRWDARPS